MRARIRRESLIPTTRPWRVYVLTPAGWVKVPQMAFETASAALDYLYDDNSEIRWPRGDSDD